MSQAFTVVDQATQVDWNVFAAASATFVATAIATILGLRKGRKDVEKQINPDQNNPHQIVGAVLQDNQSLRESTLINREVRDQLFLVNHSLNRHTEAMKGLTEALDRNTAASRKGSGA